MKGALSECVFLPGLFVFPVEVLSNAAADNGEHKGDRRAFGTKAKGD